MRFDIVLNEPDTGEISVNLSDPNAVEITSGRLIKMVYRGGAIGSGGFFVENITDDLAASGDRNGQWKKVSGRGGLAILDDAIVWSTTDASRTFTSVTMGSILLTLINEARARGCFPTMRTEFSATEDSNGDLWTDSTTITLQTGTSLLDVARQFAELGLEFKLILDWVLGDFALYVYGSPTGTDKSAVAVVRLGHNAEQLSESKESSALKNAYLVTYQAGITSTTDAASIAAYRRREAFFQAGNAPSSGSALILANAELAARKDPVHSITVKLNDGATPPRFDVDYQVGDWIGVDWGNGAVPSSYRVRGASLDWPADRKYASIILTLNSIRLEQELRTAIAMRKIANGSLGGGTSSAPADGNAAVDAHDADVTAHSTRPLAGDLAGTLNAPAVAKLRGVALDNPLTHSDGQVLTYKSGTNQIEFATPLAGGGGAGCITVLGLSWDTEVGTWAVAGYTGQVLGFCMAQAGPADGEYITYKIWLDAGTYTFLLCHIKGGNGGLCDIYIDAVEIGSADQYNAATTYNQSYRVDGIVIATSGIKVVKFLIDGKNASSSGYKAWISYFSLWRTG